MTKGVVKSSKKKQRLYVKFLKNRNHEKELNYKQYKTLFQSLKSKSKKNVGCYKRNNWKQNSHQRPSSQFYHGEKQRNIRQEIVETFNNYFVNIGPNLAASIPERKMTFQNYIHYDCPCLSTINLTEREQENAFASLKTNKSSGYDDISADVVKRVSDKIFVILRHIFSISLAKGVFPDKPKIAPVSPIFKKGSTTLVTNYRPI